MPWFFATLEQETFRMRSRTLLMRSRFSQVCARRRLVFKCEMISKHHPLFLSVFQLALMNPNIRCVLSEVTSLTKQLFHLGELRNFLALSFVASNISVWPFADSTFQVSSIVVKVRGPLFR